MPDQPLVKSRAPSLFTSEHSATDSEALKSWKLKRERTLFDAKKVFLFGLEGFWGQPLRPNFPSPWATMLALRLDCSTAALATHQKVLPIWKLVELKMLDFSDRTKFTARKKSVRDKKEQKIYVQSDSGGGGMKSIILQQAHVSKMWHATKIPYWICQNC